MAVVLNVATSLEDTCQVRPIHIQSTCSRSGFGVDEDRERPTTFSEHWHCGIVHRLVCIIEGYRHGSFGCLFIVLNRCEQIGEWKYRVIILGKILKMRFEPLG